MGSKWRWRIAGWLNRLPWTCWTSLVGWAQGGPHSRRLLDLSGNEDDIRQDSMCRTPTPSGRCYCGKIPVAFEHIAFEVTGDDVPTTPTPAPKPDTTTEDTRSTK